MCYYKGLPRWPSDKDSPANIDAVRQQRLADRQADRHHGRIGDQRQIISARRDDGLVERKAVVLGRDMAFLRIEPLVLEEDDGIPQSCQTLRPHESQHARPPCPSPTPGVCQCRGHGFSPWSRKVSQAEQLTLWTTTSESAPEPARCSCPACVLQLPKST